MENISPEKLLPRVVHRDYFAAVGVADIDRESHRFGIVRPLGNDVYAFLAHCDENEIRNVHVEHLSAAGLTVGTAWETALRNLRGIASDGKAVSRGVIKAKDGRDWSVWHGSNFTSSIVLLPELFSWAKQHLKAESFLVRIAATQMIVILHYSHLDHIPHFDKYVAKVLDGSTNLVSEKWFKLSESGIESLSP